MQTAEVISIMKEALPDEIVEAFVEASKKQLTGHICIHFKKGVPMVIKTEKETRIKQ